MLGKEKKTFNHECKGIIVIDNGSVNTEIF